MTYQGELCDNCDKPFAPQEWMDRHTCHDDGCPNIGIEDDPQWHCKCDNNYHGGCCVTCLAEDERELDARAAKLFESWAGDETFTIKHRSK